MTDVTLEYELPVADLAPYVTLFYRFRADLAVFEDIERADHAQLRFRLSPGPASYRFFDGSEQDAPPCHIVGPTTGAFVTRVAGPVLVFGMGLTPAGWAALIGVDASVMHNRAIDSGAIFGPLMRETADALAGAPTPAAMAAIVEPVLRELIARRDGVALDFIRAVDAWLADSPSPDIDDLVGETGLSRRQVERRCNALYGAPPKLLARKYRALRAAVMLASADGGADAAIAESFYDQSHMIREIKQFTGLTPRRMREEPGLLAQLTITQRRALGGQVHPIISET